MPAALDVDREAVKTLALAVGVGEAARRMNLPEGTVRQWSARGEWLKASAQPPTVIPTPVTGVTSPSQAYRNWEESKKGKIRLNAMRYLDNGFKVAAKARNPVEIAHGVKALMGVYQGVWPEQAAAPQVQLNVWGAGMGSPDP